MATIINQQSREVIKLRSQHVFGRHPATSHTLLTNQSASRMHATIYWNGNCWLIKDSSSNGTFHNNKKLKTGMPQKLQPQDKIQFGSASDSIWQLFDAERPLSMLICVGQQSRSIELKDLTVLPDIDSPEISIYQDGQSQWIIETQDEQSELVSGKQVIIDNQQWVFINPDDIDETMPVTNLPEHPPVLNFDVSSDEEHVELSIEWNKQHFVLGERVHHYLLLCLARKRLSDQNEGYKSQEQGWLDKDLLVKMTGMEEKHINIQIYRFRKQLLDSIRNTTRPLSLIERRRGLIRLACQTINVKGGHDFVQAK